MLLLPVLLGCGSSPGHGGSAADHPKRQHHAATPEEGHEADVVPDEGARNKAPVVRAIVVQPTQPSVLDTMTVKVNAVDPEGKDLAITYTWRVDGAEVAGHNEPSLDLSNYLRGQKVQITVDVSDGLSGAHGESETYAIANPDPHFTVTPDQVKSLDGFRMTAEDADGDEVKWKVEGAPPGLTIDAAGRLHYKGSETDKGGKYTIKVLAEDGHGGKGTMELPLEVAAGSKSAPPPEGALTGAPAGARPGEEARGTKP